GQECPALADSGRQECLRHQSRAIRNRYTCPGNLGAAPTPAPKICPALMGRCTTITDLIPMMTQAPAMDFTDTEPIPALSDRILRPLADALPNSKSPWLQF